MQNPLTRLLRGTFVDDRLYWQEKLYGATANAGQSRIETQRMLANQGLRHSECWPIKDRDTANADQSRIETRWMLANRRSRQLTNLRRHLEYFKGAFFLHRAFSPPRTERSRPTSDPPRNGVKRPRLIGLGHSLERPTVCLPETKWVRSTSDIRLINQSNGLPQIT